MEIRQEESAFRRRLYPRLSQLGFVQNIELSTTSGVPDVYFERNGIARWLELKIVQQNESPLIRKEQRVWSHRHAKRGGISKVVAYSLNRDAIIIYRTPIIEVKKSGRYLRIMDEPESSCDWPEFRGDKIVSMLNL